MSDPLREIYEIREGLIFLIEITPEILAPNATLGGDCQLSEVLAAILSLMETMIKTERNTGFGVYFYHSLVNDDDSRFLPVPKSHPLPNFYALFPLTYVNITNRVKLAKLLRRHQTGEQKLNQVFTPVKGEPSDVISVMENVMEVFQRRFGGGGFNRAKLVWLTTNEFPCATEADEKVLRRKIQDFFDLRIDVRPVMLAHANGKFNNKQFNDLFLNTGVLDKSGNLRDDNSGQPQPKQEESTVWRGSAKAALAKGSTFSKDIRSLILKLKQVKRQQFACPLILSDGKDVAGSFGVSVRGFALVSEDHYSRRDTYVYSQASSKQEVHTEQNIIDPVSGEPIKLTDESEGKAPLPDVKEENHIYRGVELTGGDVMCLTPDTWRFINSTDFDHDPTITKTKAKNDNDGSGTDYSDSDEDDELDDEEDWEVVGGNDGDKLSLSHSPYLKLIGFRDLDTYKPWYSFGKGSFVTVDFLEGRDRGGFTNSFTTFSALYQSCVKLKKYAVVFGPVRKGSRPALYVMYPSRVQHAKKPLITDKWDFAEGFFLYRLPWLDDIRSLPSGFEEMSTEAQDEHVEVFRQLIDDLAMTYTPESHSNPSLEWWYKILLMQESGESMELEDPKDLMKNDSTTRQVASVRKALSMNPELVEQLEEVSSQLGRLALQEEAAAAAATKTKRARSDGGAGDKRAKSSTRKSPDISLAPTDDEIVLAYGDGSLAQFTVPQLRAFQQKYASEIPRCTNKTQYLEAIVKFVEKAIKSADT
ncbi:hypothetical protein DIURU_002217 [Diutina rugosa]|uniref:DNA helicase n=1 Tax=Diutina rugosa TaxID=5481 RepID=A0A642USJ1_DIURU|nr:uncharacterized protein DIURU_002217 [Diutina rugosa]KAA8903706.1 hypothetical protein DIURU_002217 [Diutina rugosa]